MNIYDRARGEHVIELGAGEKIMLFCQSKKQLNDLYSSMSDNQREAVELELNQFPIESLQECRL